MDKTAVTTRRPLAMVQIRSCRQEDLKIVQEIAERNTSFDTTLTFSDIEGLQARNPEYFLVSEDSSRVTGFITGYERKGLPEEVLRNWKATRVGYVDLMAVDTVHRRRGVGTALLDSLLTRFKRNGIDAVILDVPANQRAAVRLYEKMGFQTRAYNMMKHL